MKLIGEDPNEIIWEVPLTWAEYRIIKISLERDILEMRTDIERRGSMEIYNSLCRKFWLKEIFLTFENQETLEDNLINNTTDFE
jgi:hypothetical protein